MWEDTVALKQIIQDPVFQILSCDPCKTRQDTICSSESLSPEWGPSMVNYEASPHSLKWKGTYL